MPIDILNTPKYEKLHQELAVRTDSIVEYRENTSGRGVVLRILDDASAMKFIDDEVDVPWRFWIVFSSSSREKKYKEVLKIR